MCVYICTYKDRAHTLPSADQSPIHKCPPTHTLLIIHDLQCILDRTIPVCISIPVTCWHSKRYLFQSPRLFLNPVLRPGVSLSGVSSDLVIHIAGERGEGSRETKTNQPHMPVGYRFVYIYLQPSTPSSCHFMLHLSELIFLPPHSLAF